LTRWCCRLPPRHTSFPALHFKVIGDKANIAFCLFLDCPEKVLEARLLKRGETSGRSDDNIESILKRFKTYASESLPIIEMFQKQDKCHKIVTDVSIEEVFESVRACLPAPTPSSGGLLGSVPSVLGIAAIVLGNVVARKL
jgi:adenylate kinase family enzyme